MNSKSVKPLYQQIEASIRSDIQTHIYKTGDKLPTETELSAKYNVSKITIRKAMEKLSHNGLIQKVQGMPSTFLAMVFTEQRSLV